MCLKNNRQNFYIFKAYLGIDPQTGKQIHTTRRGFKTKKEASLALAQLRLKSNSNEIIIDSKMTFEELTTAWLEQYKNTVKESTYVVQELAIKKHILPLFGKIQVTKISVPYCQKQVNYWFSYYKKYSNLIGLTSSILQFAIPLKIIQVNPMNNIVRPKKQKKIDEEEFSAPFYSKQELIKFLNIVEKDYSFQLYIMFRLLAFTGLRKGELLALRWKDINFSNGTLSVKQTLTTVSGWRLEFQTPKTQKSVRTMSLDATTIQLIKKWKNEQRKCFLKLGINALDKDQLLFTQEDNRPIYLDYLNHNLRKIVNDNNLKEMTVHGFRHTHCSLLFEAGSTIKEVQERLGHTDIKTTMNIYAHVTEKQKEKTADTFAEFMSN
ncbi:site-specific integrase [Enterococcus faecalis]|uniref:site-specific integrase n=1 Tax=Enterococcus TaxID=1350 RepID=UPI000F8088A6|nr:site-specific integrase [Enterococcus faecalis]EGO6570114.1 site-specific integrase [Enterococcus faecalis]EGO6688841.1 site-specific integrase [Enterococcus faecalis]EGO8279961.1 site-specific integrase [Enterococcus faecalis]EGO8519993.1 site-specific integrase [Enterococcus faecalis]EHK9404535.1 site-specific integrase [Enterococcus faecalis]